MKITVQSMISMGHRLPSYNGICSSPHGHNIMVEVGVLTETFLDFKLVSKDLDRLIGDLDHAMVLHKDDPLLDALLPFGFRLVVLDQEPTSENVAQYIFNEMGEYGYRVAHVTVYETARYFATITSGAAGPRRLSAEDYRHTSEATPAS